MSRTRTFIKGSIKNAGVVLCVVTLGVLKELLLIMLTNVAWCVGSEAQIDHVLLDELAKLLLVIVLMSMSVTQVLVVDLNKTIWCI